MRIVVALLSAIALTGCGSPAEPWGKVSGTVTYQGKPVETAILLFSNRDLGVEVTTFTDAQGRYVFHTAKVPGLPAGEYRVAITPYSVGEPTNVVMFDKAPPKTNFPNIPIKYRTIESSGLSATIGEGENTFDFDMVSGK